jgi:hypothetical protein
VTPSRLRPRRRLGIAATCCAILFALSCQGDPVRVTAPPEPVVPQEPIAPLTNYEPVGNVVTVPLASSTNPAATADLPYFAKRTLVRVTLSGSINTTLTPFNDGAANQPQAPGAPRTFGPAGYYWGSESYHDCGAQLRVTYPNAEAFWPPCASNRDTDGAPSASTHIYAQGIGWVARSGPAPNTSGSSDCWYYAPNYYSGTGPCFYYSTDGQTVTLERVAAELALTVTDPNPDYQDSVSFRLSVSPGSVDSKDIPWTLQTVTWTPDDGSYGLPTQPCQWTSFQPVDVGAVRTCTSPVWKSGTLTVTAIVNGQSQTRSVHITIRRPVLKISPERSDIVVGDTLVHTVSVTPATKKNGSPASWQVTNWRFKQTVPQFWSGQACGAVLTCKTGPYQIYDQAEITVYATINGTADSALAIVTVRSARLKLSATPSQVQGGDTVVFTASSQPSGFPISVSGWRWVPADGSGSTVPTCTGSGVTCRTTVNKTGTMWVFGSIGTNAPDSADASVAVVNSCPAMNVATANRAQASRYASASVMPLPCAEGETGPKLRITCTANGVESYDVSRGTTIACRVTGDNGQPIDASAGVNWHFGGGGFAIDTTFQGDTWTGPLVTSGAIQAQATVNGVVLKGQRGLKAKNRDWSSKTMGFTFTPVISTSTIYRPKRERDIGNAPIGAYMAMRMTASSAGPQTTAVVQEGPNAGLTYFLEIPLVGTMSVFIAQGAMTAGSDWYNLQPAGPAAYPGGAWCTQGDVVPFLPLVEQHEGLPNASGQYPANSQAVVNRALNAADRVDVTHPIPYCKFKFFTN